MEDRPRYTWEEVADIRSKIADPQAMERVLTEAICECDRGERPRCPLIEVLSEGSPTIPGTGEFDHTALADHRAYSGFQATNA